MAEDEIVKHTRKIVKQFLTGLMSHLTYAGHYVRRIRFWNVMINVFN